MANNCKMCGTENADGVQFCAACGSEMIADAGKPKPRARAGGGVPAKTMIFGQTAPTAKPAQPSATATKKEPAKTMLGMSVPVGVGKPAQQQAPMATPQQAPMAAPRQDQPQAPMAKPSGAAKPSSSPAKSADRAHTVLGLPVTAEAAKTQSTKPVPKASSASSGPAADVHDDKRTVLGMPAVDSESIKAAAKTEVATSAAPVARPKPRPSTEPLQPVPISHAPAPHKPELVEAMTTDAAPVVAGSVWPDDDDELMKPSKKGGIALLAIAIIALVIVLAGGGVLVYLLAFSDDDQLRPQVFPTADGNNLTVVLPFPKAPPGTTVQVQGRSVEVLGGQARFELPIGQLALGENTVQVTYVEPGSAPETMSFPILMRHVVSDDLTGLVTRDPFFVVAFKLAPGIQLSIDGQPVQLAGDSYSHRVSLAQALSTGQVTGSNLIHKVTFQLTEAGGQTEQGQHVVSIPITELQIDRPASDASVVLETVTCAGSTEEGAQVTVNGQPASVVAARFSSSVELGAAGDHEIVITARAPGKAPRTEKVKITRLEGLEGAIAEWSADLDLRLDYPTLARDANAQVGKKVKLSGRVVNINTEKGVTAFLLYVGEGCPTGAKCAVYVLFRGETDAGLQSSVKVFGTVRGTKDVDLRSGQKETMPAVEAQFVIKEDAVKKKRRRKR